MKDRLNSILGSVTALWERVRGPALVPSICMTAAIVACLALSLWVTVPAISATLEAKATLATRIEEADAANQSRLSERQQLTLQNDQTVQQINKVMSLLLTPDEASRLLDLLYQEAVETSVTIVDLRTQPGTQSPEEASYAVQAFRLKAAGDSQSLMAYVGRLKTLMPSAALQLQNVQIVREEQTHMLTMDIALYSDKEGVSPAMVAMAPEPTPGAQQPPAAASPALTPIPSSTSDPYLVRPSGWPSDWPWPPEETWDIYTVQTGDTLYSLALRFETTVELLREMNDLEDDVIVANQPMLVPST